MNASTFSYMTHIVTKEEYRDWHKKERMQEEAHENQMKN